MDYRDLNPTSNPFVNYQRAADSLNAAIEKRQAATNATSIRELNKEIGTLRYKMCHFHERMTAVIRADFDAAPEQISMNDETGQITIAKTVRGGGSLKWLSLGDERYEDVKAIVIANREQDRHVAHVAFEHWQWQGNVKIDYLGEGAECVAIVKGNGKSVRINVSTLSVE